MEFPYRKSKIRGAPIIHIIYGAFSNKLKMGWSPDIEIILEKLLEFFKKTSDVQVTLYWDNTQSKNEDFFLLKKI